MRPYLYRFVTFTVYCLTVFLCGCAASSSVKVPDVLGGPPKGGLPSGYEWTESSGSDFAVFRSSTDKGTVLLYVGYAPDFVEPVEADRRKGRVGEMPVTWVCGERVENGNRLHTRDALATLFRGLLHVHIVSRTTREVDKLAAALADLQWTALNERRFPDLKEEIEMRFKLAEEKYLSSFFPRKTHDDLSSADRSALRSLKLGALREVMGDDWGNLLFELTTDR